MKHKELYTVRWHDTNAARQVTPSGILTLMQETANLQFERAGKPLEELRDRDGLGFMLSRISFDLLAPIRAYETLTVSTFTCGGRGLSFFRGFEVCRGEELVARGMSVWALVRIADRSLVRFSEAAAMMEFGDEEPITTEMPLQFRVHRDQTFKTVGTRTITYADIDYNMHMNNTHYPNMLCDFLPDPAGTAVTGMSLSYLREAAFGDTLTVERAETEPGVFCFRTRKGDTVCLEALVRTKSL